MIAEDELRALIQKGSLDDSKADYRVHYGNRPTVTVGPCLVGDATAIVCWSEARGFLDGEGGLMVLKHTGESWTVRDRIRLFVS